MSLKDACNVLMRIFFLWKFGERYSISELPGNFPGNWQSTGFMLPQSCVYVSSWVHAHVCKYIGGQKLNRVSPPLFFSTSLVSQGLQLNSELMDSLGRWPLGPRGAPVSDSPGLR